MAKDKTQFVCSECGVPHLKWVGQCSECAAWNSLKEFSVNTNKPTKRGLTSSKGIEVLNNVQQQAQQRISTGLSELDRTLGGGLVEGSVVLLGGDPGIGKSTLILQSLAYLNKDHNVLYVSGEESAAQIAQRAKRLGIDEDIMFLSEVDIDAVLSAAQQTQPKVIVVDSIQTMTSEQSASAAGSVSQVRECALQLTLYAKNTDTILFLIGHVTKEGALAGPRILEHMVDVVLYFEGDAGGRYRLIRSVKNRFGAVNELSVFAMTHTGLKQIENPSAIFLSHQDNAAAGRVVSVIREGTRALLIEIQALVDKTSGQFRRVCVGFEQNRLALQLAVLHKHGAIGTLDQDVFVNVVGGVRVNETAIDLAVIFAIASSISGKVVPKDWVVFGEVGLTGEVRPVYNGEARLLEAAKQGFKTAIMPKANQSKQSIKGLKIIAVDTVQEALAQFIN